MICVRDSVKQQKGLMGFIANVNFLWDSLVELPDFYCSSIQDYKENFKQIEESRSILFKKFNYDALEGNEKFQLSDKTDKIEANLIYNINKLESFFDSSNHTSNNELLKNVNSGDNIYDIFATHKKGNLYVLGFNINGPAKNDSTQENYLTFKFPQLIPVLGNI